MPAELKLPVIPNPSWLSKMADAEDNCSTIFIGTHAMTGRDEHESDYKPEAWKEYPLSELGLWVHLFAKRATHRSDKAKVEKDLTDAQNYLTMMQDKLNDVKASLLG